jgi:hypothetical protein
MTLLARLTHTAAGHSIFMEWHMRYIFLGGFPSESLARLAAARLAGALQRQIVWRNT